MSPLMKIGKFVFRNWPGLVLFARQSAASRADAKDIVQEAFIRFWRRATFDPESRAALAAVRSVGLDFLRRDARRPDAKRSSLSMRNNSAAPASTFGRITTSAGRRGRSFAREQREVVVMKIWNE